jgi:type IV pilus assembly protein PilM
MKLPLKFQRKRRLIGIDVGTATTKIVVLQKYNNEVVVLATIVINNREEDLFTEQEISGRIAAILEADNFSDEEAILGLPHHYGMTQLVDFPPGSEKRLDELVGYEAGQIAGLSGEEFITDFAAQQPFYRYKLPVAICLCREELIRHRVTALEDAALNLSDITLEGIGLANAFLYVEPEARNRNEVLLLLDIGAVNSTMILLMKGQVFYTASIPFGGDMFTDALAQHLEVSQEEAESVKYNSRILVSDLNSPLTATARALSSEIQGSLEQWKMQAQAEDDPDLKVAEICLCGGGSLLSGLDEFFQIVYEVPVRRLTVTNQQELQAAALYPIAYGLALQGFDTGEAACPISAAPEEIKLQIKRRQNFPHIIASSWILSFVLAVSLAITYRSLTLEEVALGIRRDELASCERHVPALDAMVKDIDIFNHMLIPFVSRAHRNRTFVESVHQLGRWQHKKDWFVVIADKASYDNDGPPVEVQKKLKGEQPLPRASPMGGIGLLSQKNSGQVIASLSELEYIKTNQIEPWREIIAVGYTNGPKAKPLIYVDKLGDDLNMEEDSMFQNVDSVKQGERQDWHQMKPWGNFLMRDFALRLPLKEIYFESEVSETE